MDPKELKKLADACRKAGIKTYKCGDIEFTLTDEVPLSNYKKSKAKETKQDSKSETAFETDSLTENELLFWSTGSQPSAFENEDQ